MKYIIIEIQKANNGEVAIVPPATYAEYAQAEQTYHQALSFAAVSAVDVHSVIMLSDTGDRIKGQTYYHGQEPHPAE